MTSNTKTRSHLTLLLAGVAMAGAAATPAQAGPFDFIKRAVKQELKETFEATTESVVESAMQTAVETTFKVEKGEQAQASREGFRQEGHTTVGTADDIQAPELAQAQVGRGRTQARAGIGEAMTSQNGTTVETASEVQSDPAATAADAEPQDAFMTFNGPDAAARSSVQYPYRLENKMSQNGTTVETASEVQAQQRPQAVPPSQTKGKVEATWKVEEGEAAAAGGGAAGAGKATFKEYRTNPARARMSQNGTTVETASEVQAPQAEQAGLLLPAVQANRAASRPQRGKLSQNGTTVATANEVQAPNRERD